MAGTHRSSVVLVRSSLHSRRSNESREAKPQLLPSELRHIRAAGTVRQPPMAPNLDDRVLDRLRRLDLLLFLSLRAPRCLQSHCRRPRGADRARCGYDRRAGFDSRVVECADFCVNWRFNRWSARDV
ncbi:hypothetical protein U1Q18_023290 [Sarracenia purpurea var. burkii]